MELESRAGARLVMTNFFVAFDTQFVLMLAILLSCAALGTSNSEVCMV